MLILQKVFLSYSVRMIFIQSLLIDQWTTWFLSRSPLRLHIYIVTKMLLTRCLSINIESFIWITGLEDYTAKRFCNPRLLFVDILTSFFRPNAAWLLLASISHKPHLISTTMTSVVTHRNMQYYRAKKILYCVFSTHRWPIYFIWWYERPKDVTW